MASAYHYHPEPLPPRSPVAAQAARIRSRVRVSDHLARALAEMAFGSHAENAFGPPQPTSAGTH